MKKIVHIDMDAFFASVEQRDSPALRGKPVAVGGEGRGGIVAAASYEARRFGVHSAMPGHVARRLCPGLIFIAPNFRKYHEASEQIMKIFHNFTDLVEPLSLDEAYLDVTRNKRGLTAEVTAREIKRRVKKETGLTASAGVADTKFLAKVASGFKKPDGLTIITPARAHQFINRLPIGEFPGVGRVTEEKMRKLGVKSGADLKKLGKIDLVKEFGSAGEWFYDVVRNRDRRAVVSEWERKSLGAEQTLERDLRNLVDLEIELKKVAQELARRAAREGIAGRTLTLKIKFSDFTSITRRKTVPENLQTFESVYPRAQALLRAVENIKSGVRLLGLSISNLDNLKTKLPNPQLKLDL